MNLVAAIRYQDHESDVLDSVKNGIYASIWNIVTLSNILGWSIRSMYPQVENSFVGKSLMNKTKIPAVEKFLEKSLNVMWTHSCNTRLKGWTPNYFILCVSLKIKFRSTNLMREIKIRLLKLPLISKYSSNRRKDKK